MPRFVEDTRDIPYAKASEVELESANIDAWLAEKQNESHAATEDDDDISSWIAEKTSTLPTVAQTTQAAAWFSEKKKDMESEQKEEKHELENQWKEARSSPAPLTPPDPLSSLRRIWRNGSCSLISVPAGRSFKS